MVECAYHGHSAPRPCRKCLETAWETFDYPTPLTNADFRALLDAAERPEQRAAAAEARVAILEERLRQIVDAVDARALSMDSHDIGGHDDIPIHPWHEEWLHHARAALSPAAAGRDDAP